MSAAASAVHSQHAQDDTLVGGGDTSRPRAASSQPPPDSTEHHGTAVDLTESSPEPTDSVSVSPFHRGSSGSPEGATGIGQSLGCWLQPAPSRVAAAAATKGGRGTNRRRKRPLQGAESSDLAPPGTDMWEAFSQRQEDDRRTGGRGTTRGGDGTLTAWLERRPSDAAGRAKRSAPREGALDAAVAGHRSSEKSDSEDEQDGGDEHGRWMSARLEGLDPTGAARYVFMHTRVHPRSEQTPT